jgi:hypothetical protein
MNCCDEEWDLVVVGRAAFPGSSCSCVAGDCVRQSLKLLCLGALYSGRDTSLFDRICRASRSKFEEK